MKNISAFVFVIMASSSMNTLAVKVDMTPGLWEQTFKFTDGSLNAAYQENLPKMQKMMEEMKKQLEKMPPEQRKMMEDMMVKNNVQMTDGGISTKACITKEEIERGELPKPEKDCESSVTQVSATVFKTSYSCKGDKLSQGTSEVTFQNSKSYTGTVTGMVNANNKKETIKGEMSGKWLAKDCGDVKPINYDEEEK